MTAACGDTCTSRPTRPTRCLRQSGTPQPADTAEESVDHATAATNASVDQRTIQRPAAAGGDNRRSASSQTSRSCMGDYISDLLRVKDKYDKLQKEVGCAAGGGGGEQLGKRDRD